MKQGPPETEEEIQQFVLETLESVEPVLDEIEEIWNELQEVLEEIADSE